MPPDSLAQLITSARKRLGLSQQQLANRVGVSVNTLGELERGNRPRVALETVYKIMDVTGISAVFRAPDGVSAEVRPRPAPDERAARAAARRATWTGGVVAAHTAAPPTASGSPAARLSALSRVSQSAYAVAAAGATSPSGHGTARTRVRRSGPEKRSASTGQLAAGRPAGER
jgi:transcriptional regulator with XRE-family HTH domain